MDHSQHNIHHDDGHHDHMHHSIAPATPTPSTIGFEDSHSGHEDHGGHDHSSMMDHMMMMAFHFGYDETILFSWWKIDTVSGLLVSMLIIFIMATLYEGLKYYRERLFWKTYNLLEYRPVSVPEKNSEDARANSTVHYVGEVIHKQPPSMLSLMHLYQTFLHILQVTLSFLLMLIFMTYNVWLCMAVVIGAAVGYFMFCWKKSVIVDVTEHCH